ncbi:hypothetical protein DRH27_04740 [Candidatus Falkowbacteria bacterium]|nr:MAG: hypothetical protein DRH27_04740 [Candidatus Falkowbacteria bacterium]
MTWTQDNEKEVREQIAALTAEVAELKERLKPAEFFTTELLSLEQVMPLDCRAEANAVIDVVMGEVGKYKADNKALLVLLKVAKCPCCDGSGGFYDTYGNACQCQWCYETKQALERRE